MASLSELPLKTRLFLKAYRFRRIDPLPWTPLRKPLSQCRVAIVTSGAFIAPGQEPFDEDVRGGDSSFRILPADVELGELRETHRSESFDHSGLHEDPNLGFPLDRLRELAAEGTIGGVAVNHLSLMGSITTPGRLVNQTAPEAVTTLVNDQVDLALLVPV